MKAREGSLLVEVLVVIVIVAILAVAYLGLINRHQGDEEGKSMPKAATDKARGVECANNLRQLRMLIQTKLTEDGDYPAALDPTNSICKCPVTGKPYSYDPRTGHAWCTSPGHEAF